MTAAFDLPTNDAAWMEQGLCRQIDPDLWHPGKGGGSKAKRMCHGCPVTEECLAYALEHDEHGIWGATSYQERLRMVNKPLPRKLQPIKHGTPEGARMHYRRGEVPLCTPCIEAQRRYENARVRDHVDRKRKRS